MPLIEYIMPRSAQRTLLICALNDHVATLAQKLHEVNPTCFGLYIYRGSDHTQELLMQIIQRQYMQMLQINTAHTGDYSVYVETPRLDNPLIAGLTGRAYIQIRQKESLSHIQINVSAANAGLTCVWLAPLLHNGAARL